mmetsp:Transcript_3936/g.5311  ORF Transcript_3936/g.5311 Transcript_3936/m.5311 type:complete len:230 (+) Transcript_3936:352-1041(+)
MSGCSLFLLGRMPTLCTFPSSSIFNCFFSCRTLSYCNRRSLIPFSILGMTCSINRDVITCGVLGESCASLCDTVVGSVEFPLLTSTLIDACSREESFPFSTFRLTLLSISFSLDSTASLKILPVFSRVSSVFANFCSHSTSSACARPSFSSSIVIFLASTKLWFSPFSLFSISSTGTVFTSLAFSSQTGCSISSLFSTFCDISPSERTLFTLLRFKTSTSLCRSCISCR